MNQIVKIKKIEGKCGVFIGVKGEKRYMGIGAGKLITWSLITKSLYDELWQFDCKTALGQNIETEYR